MSSSITLGQLADRRCLLVRPRDVDRLADRRPDGTPELQRPAPGLLPHRAGAPARHRDDRHPGPQRQPDDARLALPSAARPPASSRCPPGRRARPRRARANPPPRRARTVARAADHRDLLGTAEHLTDDRDPEQLLLGEEPRAPPTPVDRFAVRERVEVRDVVARDDRGPDRGDPLEMLVSQPEPEPQRRQDHRLGDVVPGLRGRPLGRRS